MDFQVVICDDDLTQANNLAFLVQNSSIIMEDDIKITTGLVANTAEMVLEYVQLNKASNLIFFLDIQLSSNSDTKEGLDLAERIKEIVPKAQIVFVTTHDELALLTYQRRLAPLDYIIKTNNQQKLQRRITETIELAIRKIQELDYIKKTTFSYKMGTRIININYSNVLYITTTKFPHKLKIVFNNGEGEFTGDIKHVEKKYVFFKKISQSCLANLDNITSIDTRKRIITFMNGDKIQYSRSKSKMVNSLWKDSECDM